MPGTHHPVPGCLGASRPTPFHRRGLLLGEEDRTSQGRGEPQDWSLPSLWPCSSWEVG